MSETKPPLFTKPNKQTGKSRPWSKKAQEYYVKNQAENLDKLMAGIKLPDFLEEEAIDDKCVNCCIFERVCGTRQCSMCMGLDVYLHLTEEDKQAVLKQFLSDPNMPYALPLWVVIPEQPPNTPKSP
jgi:hypothetical protein